METDRHVKSTGGDASKCQEGAEIRSDNTGGEQPGSKPERAEELFAIDSQCLAKLAQGSSVLIASLLAIPDAVALIPGATSPLGWLLRLIGVWISAAVLWFVGFLGILQAVRLLVRGVSVGPEGVKLWRLAKPIAWDKLEAVAIEPQVVFSRLFSLETTARKLTIYSKFMSDKKIFKKILVPQPVPSFFFRPETFESMVRAIIARKFDLDPVSINGVFAFPQTRPPLKTTYKALRYQQILVTILIAVGLVGLLGRKAAVNYVYNSGNHALQTNNLLEAERLYRSATEIDPFFYAPFNNLANVEFRRGEFTQALKHWERALRLKPDFVEPMISISYLHLQKGEYAKAKELINSALLLAPLNSHALVNRADYFLRMGNLKAAMGDASNVISREAKEKRPIYTAQCILAEGLIRSGKPKEGLKKLDAFARNFNELEFNRTLWLLAKSDALLQLGDLKSARNTALEAQRRAGDSRDVLIQLARISIARKNAGEARYYVERLMKFGTDDPWSSLLQARVLLLAGERKPAQRQVERAMQLAHNDALLFAEAGWLFHEMKDEQRAKEAARKSLELEPLTDSALKLLESVQSSAR
ncbi:MAG: tetratricopeptide repeat protein [Candidatus Melainabacteria bacterium]|nr:tetratricopeptide repeat protein [Candidatus Melainabacteria bacterium]